MWILLGLAVWIIGAAAIWRVIIARERRPEFMIWGDVVAVTAGDHIAVVCLAIIWPLIFAYVGAWRLRELVRARK